VSGTKTTLVDDLLTKPASPLRDAIIRRAKRGHYHDLETTVATPKMELDYDLRQAGFNDLADKARAGDYDDEWIRK